ncbi:hypothetical protein [Catenuloplanes japonicus]|uniref:hypothetical protein n=1 Tax=Catenuloplanes japonicus TaxID=33876 RepID=UPI000523FD4D|nr:hypothetical protein [Catenuloplanes japonicus]
MNKLIRQVHRWLSIVFTAAVVLVTVLLAVQGEPAGWVYTLPVLPLLLLLVSGLYLFVLPYVQRRRRASAGA